MAWLQQQLAAHQDALLWVSILSAVMFAGSIALVPVLVARAPADLFVREPSQRRGLGRLLRQIVRNLFGLGLLVLGVLMLVLPGQGLLMVLLALLVLDFPGKRALVQRLVRRPKVWDALHYVRQRANKPPFERP
jgi:hypothetical protein